MSFVVKLRTLAIESKNLNDEMDDDIKQCESSPCKSPSYSVTLRDKISQSRKKEKYNEHITKINNWAISLGYEAPNQYID